MALSRTLRASGLDTTNDPTTITPSATPASGSVGLLILPYAVIGGESVNAGDSFTVTGVYATWTEIGQQVDLSNRRGILVYLGSGTVSAGSVSADFVPGGGQTWAETGFFLYEINGHDTGTPNDATVTGYTGGATSLALGDVGTPSTGDWIFASFWIESASLTPSIGDGYTDSTTHNTGDNIRTIITAWHDGPSWDETPTCSWSGTNACGGVAGIINAGAAAGRTTKNTRSWPLGVNVGMGWRMPV